MPDQYRRRGQESQDGAAGYRRRECPVDDRGSNGCLELHCTSAVGLLCRRICGTYDTGSGRRDESVENENEEGDKITSRLWNLWLVSIYLLPFIKAVETYIG